MSSSAWLKNAIALAILNGTDLTHLSTVYVALFTAAPTDADGSGTEVTGTGYARVAVACDTSHWTAPSQSGTNQPYTSSNVNTISFGNAGAGGWGTITYFALMTAVSSGHIVASGALQASIVANAGVLVEFAAGALVVSVNN